GPRVRRAPRGPTGSPGLGDAAARAGPGFGPGFRQPARGHAPPSPRPAWRRRRPVSAPVSHAATDVAIVGMAGRFPGAPDVETLWAQVAAGRDCLTDLAP